MADGTLIFDTKIDTKGISNAQSVISQSFDRLKKRIKGVETESTKYGDSLKKTTKEQNAFAKSASDAASASGKMSSAFGKLAKAALAVVSIRSIVNFGKEALEAASNLQEVQNVVDTAFGEMSSQVDAWAKTTVEAFGMSELSAKQFSSTYMAMSKGMGLDAQKAADMAIGATERIGDIASFYNKSFEEVDTMMKSIWTGETESLKRIGVVMTETNLKAFALSKGIKTNYADMDQATKTQLRYAYVMEQTALAQGDFLKTQGSWANQTRILSENFNQLKASIGNALIQTLTPAIQLLNKLLEKVIQVSKAFGELASSMFGKQENKQTAETAAIEASTAAEQDFKDAVDETTEAQERQLAGFDKLNKLGSNKKDSSASIAGIDIGDSLTIKPEVDTGEIDKSLDRIKTKFNEIKEKFKNFLAPLQDQFDELKRNFNNTVGLIKGIWGDIKALGSPLKEWWDSKGSQDLQKVLKSILRIVNVIWRITNTVFKDLWDHLIYPFVQSLVTVILPMVSDFVGRLSELWAHGYEAMEQVFNKVWKEGIVPALELISYIWQSICQTIANVYYQYAEPIFNALHEAIETTKELFLNIWSKIKPIWDELIQTVKEFWDEHLQPLFQEIGEFVAEAILFATTFYNKVLAPVINALVEKLAPVVINVFHKIKNIVMPIITAIVDVIKGIVRALKGVLQFLTGVFTGDFKKAFTGLKNIVGGTFDQMIAVVKGIGNLMIGIIENIINSIIHGINWVTGKINDILTFSIPDWVPGLGGKGLTVDIRQISDVHLPRLASGTVIPANYGQFAAILGDNKRETEIVSPLSTMKDAFKEALQEMGGFTIDASDVYIDGQKVGQIVFTEHNKVVARTGRTPLKGV